MATYIGFSTIGANQPKTTNTSVGNNGGVGGIVKSLNTGKKFKLVDSQLVIRDFLNAINIRQGQKVGQPQYGTTLWDFIFEPNTLDVQYALETELKRIVSLDPRIIFNSVKVYPQENGILTEIEFAISPFNQAQLLNVFFNMNKNSATLA